ncbi:MAG: hypothetical protein R8M11_04955 [Gallionella sp.]
MASTDYISVRPELVEGHSRSCFDKLSTNGSLLQRASSITMKGLLR